MDGYDHRVRVLPWLLVLAAAACGPGARPPPDDLDDELSARAEVRREQYTLWWNGARIGDVEEELRTRPDGVTLIRRERIGVRRGDRLSATRLTIEIRADRALRATTVEVGAYGDGAAASGRARRDDHGRWAIAVDGEPARSEDGDAVPAELVPLLLARDRRFDGPVLLAGRGFAVAALRVEPDGERYRAELTVPGGRLVTALELDRDGGLLRAAGADGIVAVRATTADVAAPFEPPEVVDGTAIAVTGTGAIAEDATVLRLAMAPVDRELPPPLPGQQVADDGNRWGLVLDPSLAGALPAGANGPDRTEEIVELVRTVDLRLDEDLALTAPTMTAARQARAGDCTSHALLFAALAGDTGIEVWLVTGFRLDADRLIRHRWAVAWTGTAWMAVDPTHGQAPIRSFLLGLAVHGALAEDLALADEVAFAGTGGARAKVQ